MPDLKLLRVEEGDNQKSLADKVNYNFSSIISFGGGPYGSVGDEGPQGDRGTVGPTGSYGDIGPRGSYWVVSNSDPGTTGYLNGDFWINDSPGLGNPIYQYSSGSWSQYGINLLSQDLFRIYNNIPTSSGNSSYSGYFISSVNPENYTLVLKDSSIVGATASTNPQYSKLFISINGGTAGKNLLEFSKTDYSGIPSFTSKDPRFFWTYTSTSSNLKYSLSFRSGSSVLFDFSSGQLSFSVTNASQSGLRLSSVRFNMNTSGSNPTSFTSSAGKVIMNFSSSGLFLPSTRNFSYSSGLFSISVPHQFYSGALDPNPPLWLESSNSRIGGLNHTLNAEPNRSSSLFRVYSSAETLFEVLGDGEVYANKIIRSIQSRQSALSPGSGSATTLSGGTATVTWYPIVPTNSIYTSSIQGVACSNGTDFVIHQNTAGPSATTGIYLWTPATGASADYNGGWLNLLNNYEAITIRVRSSDESRYFRFLGLGTGQTYTVLPYDPSGSYQAIDLTGSNSYGATHAEFTILNITGTGATSGSSRWFKVYYSAWGGNLPSNQCGFMYTTNSTAI